MFILLNTIFGDFKVKYDYTKCCFVLYGGKSEDVNETNINKFIYKNYDYLNFDKLKKIINKCYKIGEYYDNLLNNSLKKINKITNSEETFKTKRKSYNNNILLFYYKNLLEQIENNNDDIINSLDLSIKYSNFWEVYNLYKSKYDDNLNLLSKEIHKEYQIVENDEETFVKIRNTKYITKCIKHLVGILSKHVEEPILTNDIYLFNSIFSNRIFLNLLINNNIQTAQYHRLIECMASFCQKYGSPCFIEQKHLRQYNYEYSTEQNTTNVNKVSDLNKKLLNISVKQYKSNFDYRFFDIIPYNDENGNNFIINNINININDFLDVCYIIFHLEKINKKVIEKRGANNTEQISNLLKRYFSEEFNPPKDNKNYYTELQNVLNRFIDEILRKLRICNNIKLDERKNIDVIFSDTRSKMYMISSLQELALFYYYNFVFGTIELNKVNNICWKCKKNFNEKGHTVHADDNKSLKFKICDKCFVERKKYNSRKSTRKYREKTKM